MPNCFLIQYVAKTLCYVDIRYVHLIDKKYRKDLDMNDELEYTNLRNEDGMFGKAGGLMGTVVVLAGLLLVISLAVRSIYKDKKSGKSQCGGDCGKCRGCH